jgi:para-nitrobenzyl esterase
MALSIERWQNHMTLGFGKSSIIRFTVPMAESRRERRGSYAKGVAKREEILERALDVIAREGYRGASVKELAEAVGLSQAGLLHYFDSKEDLFTAILRKRDEVDSAGFGLADTTEVTASDLRAGYLAIIRHNAEVPGLVQLFARLSVDAADPDHAAHDFFVERSRTLRDLFAAAIAAKQASGDLNPAIDPQTLARIFQAVADGLQVQWMLEPDVDMAGHDRRAVHGARRRRRRNPGERGRPVAKHPEAPVVAIAPGQVRGFWRGAPGERGSSAAFLGIPFAQAPVGDLRFAAPVPPEPWEGVRDALEYGPTALRHDPGDTLIPEPAIPGGATLNVNVFTPVPGEMDAALPVLVYIHGGGYIAGSPASPWYDGRAFNRDGVVTVTLSYRLGFDGFGYIAGAPSNRGVRDWIAGLEWVRDNIRSFGGDPGRVTVAGQSAGGGAVLTLLGMPSAQPLFQGAWAMSAALADVSAERARTLSARLANLAGVAPTRDGFASVPEETLAGLQEKATAPEFGGPLAAVHVLLEDGLSWGPAIDGDLITRPTIASLAAGVGADKPLVLGTTDDEFTMVTDSARRKLRLIPASLALGKLNLAAPARRAYLADNVEQRRKGTAAVLGRYVTDVVFRSDVVRVGRCPGRWRGRGIHVGVPLLVAVAGAHLGTPLPRRAVLVRLPRRRTRTRHRRRRPAAAAGRRRPRRRRRAHPRRRPRLAGLDRTPRHDARVRGRGIPSRRRARRLPERARPGVGRAGGVAGRGLGRPAVGPGLGLRPGPRLGRAGSGLGPGPGRAGPGLSGGRLRASSAAPSVKRPGDFGPSRGRWGEFGPIVPGVSPSASCSAAPAEKTYDRSAYPSRAPHDVLRDEPQCRIAESSCRLISTPIAALSLPLGVVGSAVALDDQPSVDDEIDAADAGYLHLQLERGADRSEDEANERFRPRLSTLVRQLCDDAVSRGKRGEELF